MNRKLVLVVSVVLALVVVGAVAQTKPAPAKSAAAKSAPAKSAASSGDALVRAAIEKAAPGSVIDSVKPSPIAGYREVAIAGRVVYVSADGKYLLQGSLIELGNRENLTAASEAVLRRSVLDSVPRNRRIVFSPPNPKYRVTVFTDIDCSYCRKLHAEMAGFNKLGISIEYLFFPRAGLSSASYTDSVSVWCSSDQQKALTDAKLDRPVAKKTCANPVAADYELGRKIGVDGTPAIYAADGMQLGGYLSPTDMLARLERQSASKAVAAQ